MYIFFCNQKTAYDVRISDWSSDVCSSDLYDQFVDTHGDKVDSHAVVPVMIDRKFQLRADAVIGRNQQRVLVSNGFQIEKAAKTAEFSVCRSEERRVGKECVRTCQSRLSPFY